MTAPFEKLVSAPTIHVILDKLFHPKITDMLHAFIPGLFFVVCVVLGSPQFAKGIIASASTERSIQLFLVLFVAFVLGSALIQWVRLIQIVLIEFYKHLSDWQPRILNWRINRAAKKDAAKIPQVGQAAAPTGASSRTWRRLQAAQGRRIERSGEVRDTQRAWGEVATQLLERRYGIKVPYTDFDWSPWVKVLGIDQIRIEDKRGFLFTMAFHATGWGGLLASYLVPGIRIWTFLIFCLFLIVYGLLHDRQVAMSINDDGYQWRLALTYVLVELRKAREADGPSSKSDDN
jgi:hypothetical protein